MKKLVFESLDNFVRNQDPRESLNIGYKGKIIDFFREYNIPDERYEIKESGEIVFDNWLNLSNSKINNLPDNLTINGNLNLYHTTINKLPNNLTVIGDISLRNTNITELPNNLIIRNNIWVDDYQLELINFIKNSKFKNKLEIT
jgi:hypothetical protein